MPAVPACLSEPLRGLRRSAVVQKGYAESHPLGCHRRRIPDRTVFEYILLALVHGSGLRVVDFHLYLAATLVTLRMFIRRSTSRYRWDGRPTTRRLK